MPIAYCFVKDKPSIRSHLQKLASDWATEAGVDPKNITINLVTTEHRVGNPYAVMINLYLPTAWSEEDVQRIQVSLLKVVMNHLQVEAKEIFIMTSLIQSGHVVENGRVVRW